MIFSRFISRGIIIFVALNNKKVFRNQIFLWENACDEELIGSMVWNMGGNYNCDHYHKEGIGVSNPMEYCYGYIQQACSFCGYCNGKKQTIKL